MRLRSFAQTVLALAAMCAAGNAHAAGFAVDISSGINSNLATYSGGTSYPLSNAGVTINGIDFALAPFFQNDPMSQAGVVQSGYFHPTSITIDTPDVLLGSNTIFYSLANSAFGVAPNNVGNLTFNLLGGASIVYNLIEGNNLRDHFNGAFNNVAPNVFGTAVYDDDRLDAQQIVIDSQFNGSVVQSVTLNNTDEANGSPFLAALSFTGASFVTAVPEPSSWILMIGGFGLIGGAMRRARAGRPAIA